MDKRLDDDRVSLSTLILNRAIELNSIRSLSLSLSYVPLSGGLLGMIVWKGRCV